MRTTKIALLSFVMALMALPAISYARTTSQVGLRQVVVRVKGRHTLNNAFKMERFTANVSRSNLKASTADLSARRAAGKLARTLKGKLVKQFGVKGAKIAKSIKISNQAEMSKASYSYRNKNSKIDRAAYRVTLDLPLKGNKRVRGMLRDLYQDTMKPEVDRYGYSSSRGIQTKAMVDQKSVDRAVAKIVKERVSGAKKIARESLRAQGKTGKLQGVEISSYNWTWRGPTEVDVDVKAAFGFKAAR
jgi:hypothetical protein